MFYTDNNVLTKYQLTWMCGGPWQGKPPPPVMRLLWYVRPMGCPECHLPWNRNFLLGGIVEEAPTSQRGGQGHSWDHIPGLQPTPGQRRIFQIPHPHYIVHVQLLTIGCDQPHKGKEEVGTDVENYELGGVIYEDVQHIFKAAIQYVLLFES